jgi:hypothetical protein
MGLNHMSLYQADNDYEYIPVPDQNTRIYRNRFATNQFSMRSDPILPGDTCTILLVGDSVIYGGNSTDQDSLASTLLEKLITARLGRRVRVLNISAQSWGPDNGAAYIKKNGTFNSRLIVLVNSSHDAYDNMTFTAKLGKEPYRTANNVFALQTLVEKSWLIVSNKLKKNQPVEVIPDATAGRFNSGFTFFRDLARDNNIKLIDYLHSTISEQHSQRYEAGGEEIISFCANNNIEVIRGIDGETPDLYADSIHLNNRGQQYLSARLLPVILNKLQ